MVARVRRPAASRPERRSSPGKARLKPAPPELELSESADLDEVVAVGLQQLILGYIESSPEEPIVGLQRLFSMVARELGRIDGAARLHGVTRESTLKLLRYGLLQGKQVTLDQHEESCACTNSKVLQDEIAAH